MFYDITASPEGRSVDRSWISRVAAVLDIPFCVAGGIRSVADAEAILNAGAEKVSVNSPALADPDLIDRLAARFGSQCVVVGIDSQTTPEGFRVYQFTGDPNRSRDSGRDTLAWAREVQERGAGEIVLNCMASDGVRRGYDLDAAAGRARGVQCAAGGFRRRRRTRALRGAVRTPRRRCRAGRQRVPQRPDRHSRSQAAICATAISRCVHERRRHWISTRWTGARATACCPASCRMPAPTPC